MDAFQRGLSRPIPTEKAAAFFVGLKSWQQPAPEDDQLMAECIHKVAAERPRLSDQYPAGERGVHRKSKTASLLAQFRKIAAEESTHGSGEMSAPAPQDATEQYLANEAQGMAAEEQGSVQYYQQVMGQLRGQLAQVQEQAGQAQQQVEELTAAQQAHEQEVQGAQQESQLAQQAAMQQVQSANSAATQSMQQAVDAENRALAAKSNETQAKIQQQQVRSQLFDLAAQGLPGTEPPVGPEGEAANGLTPAAPAEQPQGLGGAPGADDAAAAQGGAPGAEGVPAEGEQPQAGGEAPGAGMNEAGQPLSAEGMPGQQASPEQAGAALAPNAVPPAGDSSGGAGGGSGAGPQAPAVGKGQSDPTRQGQVSIKVGHADVLAFLEERRGRPFGGSDKTAGLRASFSRKAMELTGANDLKRKATRAVLGAGAVLTAASAAGGHVGAKSGARRALEEHDRRLGEKKANVGNLVARAARNPHVLMGAGGAAVGGGLGALEAAGHGPDLDKWRGKIEQKEQDMKKPGVKGFAKSFDIAAQRPVLTTAEAIKAHPVLGTLSSAATGAALGASMGNMPRMLRDAARLHKDVKVLA